MRVRRNVRRVIFTKAPTPKIRTNQKLPSHKTMRTTEGSYSLGVTSHQPAPAKVLASAFHARHQNQRVGLEEVSQGAFPPGGFVHQTS